MMRLIIIIIIFSSFIQFQSSFVVHVLLPACTSFKNQLANLTSIKYYR